MPYQVCPMGISNIQWKIDFVFSITKFNHTYDISYRMPNRQELSDEISKSDSYYPFLGVLSIVSMRRELKDHPWAGKAKELTQAMPINESSVPNLLPNMNNRW